MGVSRVGSTAAAATTADPIVGDWNVTYGAPAVVTMTLSGGVYTVTAKTPVQVTGSSCDLPVGTIIATFSSTGGNTYSGQHGLWYTSDCSFGFWDGLTLTLSSDGNTLTGVLAGGYGTVVFTKTGSNQGCTPTLIPGTHEPALVAVFVNGVETSTPNDNFYPLAGGLTDYPSVNNYCQPYAASNGPMPPSLTGVLAGYHNTYTAFKSGSVSPTPPQGVEDLPDALAAQGAVLLPYSYRGAYFSSLPAGSSEPLFHVNISQNTDPGSEDMNMQASAFTVKSSPSITIGPIRRLR